MATKKSTKKSERLSEMSSQSTIEFHITASGSFCVDHAHYYKTVDGAYGMYSRLKIRREERALGIYR